MKQCELETIGQRIMSYSSITQKKVYFLFSAFLLIFFLDKKYTYIGLSRYLLEYFEFVFDLVVTIFWSFLYDTNLAKKLFHKKTYFA